MKEISSFLIHELTWNAKKKELKTYKLFYFPQRKRQKIEHQFQKLKRTVKHVGDNQAHKNFSQKMFEYGKHPTYFQLSEPFS